MKISKTQSAALLMLIVISNSGCNYDGSGSSGSDGTASEVAIAALGGTTNSSEGSIAWEQGPRNQSWFATLGRALNPVSTSWAVPSCHWSNVISGCSANSETLTFDHCSDLSDRAISMQGSETLFWTGSGCCTSNPLTASSVTPCRFTRRTVNKSGDSDPLIRSVGSHAIVLDTEIETGFSEPKSGGFQVTCQGFDGVDTCDGQREIVISGAHYTGQSGRAFWDHTVSTDNPLIVQGHGKGRKILSGKIRTQHNLAKFVSITSITSSLTFSNDCCYPTGGAITTAFEGGPIDGKSETVTFGSTCGEVSFENSNQKKSGFSLHHCL